MGEEVHDVVVIGAGIAGLATAVGLHRLGVRSLVLESSSELRSSGFALTTWRNAWRALDMLGVGEVVRSQHVLLEGIITKSVGTMAPATERRFNVPGQPSQGEVRCVRRNLFLEALEQALPRGTVRLGAKVVAIEEEEGEIGGGVKLLHLADGSTLRAKVLVGCDGVNSVVAKWLGLKSPAYSGRWAVRAMVVYPDDGHGFEHVFHQFNGNGFRSGFIPTDANHIYWFLTWSPSPKGKCKHSIYPSVTPYIPNFTVPVIPSVARLIAVPFGLPKTEQKDVEETPSQLKQHVLSCISSKLPARVVEVVQRTDPQVILFSPLRFRSPLDILWGATHRDNVCLAGDAFHPMTPDLGQGGCSALEDSVVLARCLAEAFSGSNNGNGKMELELEQERIRRAVDKYVKQRKWRCFELIVTSYIVGAIQQSNGALMNFARDKGLSLIMTKRLLRISDYDFGSLDADLDHN